MSTNPRNPDTPKPALPEPDYLGNDHGQAWSRDVIAQWHERNKQHFTKPLYGVATLQSAIDAAIAEALNEREFVHAESSRIYARLASVVRAGAGDAALADLLRKEVEARGAAAEARAVPKGWKLLKDTTHAERSWPEDSGHENGNYSNTCVQCLREFIGHKRRQVCKVCAATPSPAEQPKPAVRASAELLAQFKAGRPLAHSLDDYWRAPGREGPLAFQWEDKPHRLIYDLIAAVLCYQSAALQGEPQP